LLFQESFASYARDLPPTYIFNISKAVWETPDKIKRDYASASFLRDNRVVFNIKGNDYRLIVHIDYKRKIVRVKFIGTHSEYDKINAQEI